MKLIKQLFLMFALLCAAPSWAEPVEGKDYKMLNPAQPVRGKKIEVLEFFAYPCPHCFHLNPQLVAWEKKMPKDVELTYVPLTLGHAEWEATVRAFYALEAMGERARLHNDLFDAWHQDVFLTDEASTTEFVAKHGVDRNKFKQAYNSFGVQNQVMRAEQMSRSYGIRGTPTLIVDGKFVITGLQPAETIQVLNAVIDKARKERGGKK